MGIKKERWPIDDGARFGLPNSFIVLFDFLLVGNKVILDFSDLFRG
jgi:hypothetical protein